MAFAYTTPLRAMITQITDGCSRLLLETTTPARVCQAFSRFLGRRGRRAAAPGCDLRPAAARNSSGHPLQKPRNPCAPGRAFFFARRAEERRPEGGAGRKHPDRTTGAGLGQPRAPTTPPRAAGEPRNWRAARRGHHGGLRTSCRMVPRAARRHRGGGGTATAARGPRANDGAGLPPPPRRARRTHDAGGPGGPAASLHHGEERTTPAARPGRDERRRWFDQRRRARLRSLPLPGCGGCGHTFFGPSAGLR